MGVIKMIFTAISIVLISWSGNIKTYNHLLQIESFVESKPDSALKALSSIDTTTVANGRNAALYTFLTSLGRYKAYIDDYDANSIASAAEFFSHKHDRKREMISRYLQGYALLIARKYNQAIVSLTDAEQLADELGDYYFGGLCCREISQVFSKSFSPEQALLYADKAISYFDKAGMDKHSHYSLLQKGYSFRQLMDWSSAEKVYLEAERAASQARDTVLLTESLWPLAEIFVNIGENQKAIDTITRLSDSLHYRHNSATLSYLARAYAQKGDPKRALSIINTAESLAHTAFEHYNVDYQRYYIGLAIGQPVEALSSLNRVFEYAKGTEFQAIKNTALISQNDYLRERGDFLQLQKKYTEQRLYSFILGAFLFTIVFVFCAMRTYQFLHQKNITLNKEKEQLLQDLNTLSENHSRQLKTSSKSGMSFFNDLSQLYWQNQPQMVLPKLKEILAGLASDDILIKHIASDLNNTRDNIILRLAEQVPTLSKNDCLLFIYLSSQMEHNTICLILRKTPGALNAHIYRLRKKIEGSNAKDKEEFLDALE